MKSSSEVGVLLLALTVLLSLYHPTHSFNYNPIRLPTADDAGTAVLDADGDPLKPNTLYNITTAYGEVILANAGTPEMRSPPPYVGCPDSLLITSDPKENGRAVKFIPEDATATSISESTRLAIKFSFSTLPPECAHKAYWDITAGYDPSFVAPRTSFSYNFMILSDNSVEDRRYKIAYCPSDSTACFSIGTLCTHPGCPLGIMHLGICYPSLTVQFLKSN